MMYTAVLNDLSGSSAEGVVTSPVVAPGDRDVVVFRSDQQAFPGVERYPAQVPRVKILDLMIPYSDIAIRSRTITRMEVAKADDRASLQLIGVEIVVARDDP